MMDLHKSDDVQMFLAGYSLPCGDLTLQSESEMWSQVLSESQRELGELDFRHLAR